MSQNSIQLSQHHVTARKNLLEQAVQNKIREPKNTVASTRRLVADSARTVRQAGRQIDGL